MVKLVHQTEKHDWYIIRWKEKYSRTHSILYNIVDKGSKPPTTGYYQPRYIMNKMGYTDLMVYQTFQKPNCN